jgi:hypothetical protein
MLNAIEQYGELTFRELLAQLAEALPQLDSEQLLQATNEILWQFINQRVLSAHSTKS